MMSETALNPNKKTRKSRPKSSVGCITCKVRHVRCDEQKPACSRCQKSGRQCDGYSPDGRRPDQDPLQIVYSYWQSSIHQQPFVDIPGSNKERRAFHFFRENSTRDFAGFFESSFWDRLVLQASHAEPSIRHAVIALGSLHENAQQEKEKSGRAFKCDQFALQQCNKAIGHLKQNSCSNGQQLSSNMLMMSCAIFVCFESLQGNYESALCHIQGGLRIFRDWQSEAQHHRSVDSEIVQMFSRLNMQTIMFPDTRSLSPDFANQDIHLITDPIPGTFTTLKEARDCLDDCMSYLFHASMVAYFNRQTSQSSSSSSSSSNADQPQDPPTPHLFSQWSSAFSSFLSSQVGGCQTLPPKDLQVAHLLEIQYLCAQILLSVGLPPKETAFDKSLPSFEKIITLATSIINSNNNSRSPRENSSTATAAGYFTFETGLVPPLYFTATRCRNPWLRRRALSLLVAAPRQECIWNSGMLAKIAERLILIEEGRESVGEVAREDGVGVTSRVSVLNATICSERGKVFVECCQRVEGGEDEGMRRLDECIVYLKVGGYNYVDTAICDG